MIFYEIATGKIIDINGKVNDINGEVKPMDDDFVIPEGKLLDHIDITSNPPVPVFVNKPKSEMELFKEDIKEMLNSNLFHEMEQDRNLIALKASVEQMTNYLVRVQSTMDSINEKINNLSKSN